SFPGLLRLWPSSTASTRPSGDSTVQWSIPRLAPSRGRRATAAPTPHIGEDPDHSLTPAKLPVESLKPVGTAQPAAVALRERHYSHRILKTGFKTGHRFWALASHTPRGYRPVNGGRSPCPGH